MATNKNGLKRADDVLEKLVGPLTFAMFMRSMRTTRDLTQVEMAKKLCISRQALCEIESGRTHVELHTAAKYATLGGFSMLVAVEASICDQLRKAGISYNVKLEQRSPVKLKKTGK